MILNIIIHENVNEKLINYNPIYLDCVLTNNKYSITTYNENIIVITTFKSI